MSTLPDGLPPLPPVPEGFDRWEYRGIGWVSGRPVVFAITFKKRGRYENWSTCPKPHVTNGNSGHYLEAVAAPASPAKPPYANLNEYLADLEAHASPAKEVCLDQSCPVGVTHYERETPKCSAKEATREGETPISDKLFNDGHLDVTSLKEVASLERERNAAERRAADATSKLTAAESERDALKDLLVILNEAFYFIVDECDWEEDKRIGTACDQAVARIKQALAPAASKEGES